MSDRNFCSKKIYFQKSHLGVVDRKCFYFLLIPYAFQQKFGSYIYGVQVFMVLFVLIALWVWRALTWFILYQWLAFRKNDFSFFILVIESYCFNWRNCFIILYRQSPSKPLCLLRTWITTLGILTLYSALYNQYWIIPGYLFSFVLTVFINAYSIKNLFSA